jgi:hypothetical protein
MSSLRGIGAGTSGGSAEDEPGLVVCEQRRATRPTCLATGTLACPRCDAPVSPGAVPMAMTVALACPYCAHTGPVRQFLSLAAPTRPARVLVRVRYAPA